MILIILEKRNNIVETQTIKTTMKIYPFDVTPRAVLKATFEAAGDLLVGTAAGEYARLAKGANGTWLGVDVTTGLLTYGTIEAGGGMAFDMTNNSASTVAAGSVAILDKDGDNYFNVSSYQSDPRVVGVTTESIQSGEAGQIARGGKYTVLVQGNVSRGQWLIQSATTGRAMAAGYTKPVVGAIGIAVTEYAGGGAGSVDAILAVETIVGASTGVGYMAGEYTTAVANTIVKLTGANETSANLGSATLSTARIYGSAIHSSLAGFACGGSIGTTTASGTATGDKLTFSNETLSAVVGANLSANRSVGVGTSCATHGYHTGGRTTGDTAVTTTDKTLFSADTTAAAASAALGTARGQLFGLSSPTEGIVAGGTAGASTTYDIADKITFSNDTRAAVTTANLSGTRAAGGNVYNQAIGFFIGGVGVATADKCTFATMTTAACATANASSARNAQTSVSMALYGYTMGGNGSISGVDKTDFSTDTTSACASAALPAGAYGGARGNMSVAV